MIRSIRCPSIRQNLEILKIYKSNLEKVLDEEDHLYYYLTVTFGIDTYEAYLKWCTKSKKLLKNPANSQEQGVPNEKMV